MPEPGKKAVVATMSAQVPSAQRGPKSKIGRIGTQEDIAKDNPTAAFCEIAPPRFWVMRKLPGSAEKSRWTPVLDKP